MNLTVSKLKLVMPRAPDGWLEPLVDGLQKSSIDTPQEVASFVSQIAHESVEFTRLEENLNYTAQRLVQIWPKRFTTVEIAQMYARQPEKLANNVYANRIGNGDTASGDGWRFRGRGPIQITGRRNYTRCGADIGVDLIVKPELLLTPSIGIQSALWFWRDAKLDAVDDDADVRAETRRINGGETGFYLRQAYFNHCLGVLTK